MNISHNPILSEQQKTLLSRFKESELRQTFYLTGGTALSAFYISHRLSEDLDFFSEEQVGIEEILHFVKSVPKVSDVHYERKFDRKIFLLRCGEGLPLKVEFSTHPFPRCEKGTLIEGITVDSLKDILVNKLMALTDRRDPKDYVDLFCVLKRKPDLDFNELIAATESKFGVRGVKYIIRGRFLEGPPPIGKLNMKEDLDSDAMSRFFKSEAMSWISNALKEES